MWIIGEYSATTEEIDIAFSSIKEELGDMPFTRNGEQLKEEDKEKVS